MNSELNLRSLKAFSHHYLLLKRITNHSVIFLNYNLALRIRLTLSNIAYYKSTQLVSYVLSMNLNIYK